MMQRERERQGRVVVHDRETHVYVPGGLRVGDRLGVFRGNGPREGARMGAATVAGFEDDGTPILVVRLDDGTGFRLRTFGV
jgi:hypothetical protein